MSDVECIHCGAAHDSFGLLPLCAECTRRHARAIPAVVYRLRVRDADAQPARIHEASAATLTGAKREATALALAGFVGGSVCVIDADGHALYVARRTPLGVHRASASHADRAFDAVTRRMRDGRDPP